MRFLITYWYLILIFLFALILRLYQISQVPPGMHWDEAAWGYNAFSIFKTGRDEHGEFLPLVFKSFGDFKPPLYFYLTVPSVFIFGLTEFATRLPVALITALSSIILFLLVKKLFGNIQIATISTFSFAISPWSIIFSRPAFDGPIALFFLILGILFFLYGKEKRHQFLLLSSVFFLFSAYGYQTAKLIVPAFVAILTFLYKKELARIPTKWLFGSVIILFLMLPLYFGFLTNQGGRFEVMSLFSYPQTQEEITQILAEENFSKDSFLFQLWHGDWFHFLKGLVLRYTNYFSPSFLFFDGDTLQNKRHGIPVGGTLYYFDILFLLSGLFFLIRMKNTREKFLILFWLFLGPLPAALTRDQTQAHRAFTMLAAVQMIIGFGVYHIFSYLKKFKVGIPIFLLLVIFIIWNFLFFLDQYFLHMPRQFSSEWLSAQKEMALYLKGNAPKYNNVIVSDKFGQPYIFYLFHSKYVPKEYQRKNSFVPSPYGDVGHVPKLDNISFRPIYWPHDRGEKKTLFIGTEFELPPKDIEPFGEFKILKEIYFKNTNQLAYRIVESK